MIVRDPSAAAGPDYDLIVVGGGIYGVCIAMEAARRGLTPLLVERDDFGGATSWNSLRIIHGGLRYLQTLDWRRHQESVRERRWFLQAFPDLVRPLPCLMPLYGNGLKRPQIVRAALLLNDLLSRRRNEGVERCQRLVSGRIVSAMDTRLMFPAVRRTALEGSALWHDAVMLSPQRIVMEVLRAAHRLSPGMRSLNYAEVTSILAESSGRRQRAAGVLAIDRLTHETIELRAPIVVNAAGPWCDRLAQSTNCESSGQISALFKPSLAFNLLIDRPLLGDAAIAVTSGRPGGRVYFLHSACRGGVLAGTEHVPLLDWNGSGQPQPTPEQIRYTLNELNTAIPGWDVSERDVLRVYCGMLPARAAGTENLATREVILNHGTMGGLEGFYSVSGVKFTTARLVAEKVMSRITNATGGAPLQRDMQEVGVDLTVPDDIMGIHDDRARAALRTLIEHEAVVTMEDLLLRRTSWLDDPGVESALRQRIGTLLHVDHRHHERLRSGPELRRMDRSRKPEMHSLHG